MDAKRNPILIDPKEIQLDFIRSAGPGGQNVNKVSTAVQLRIDVAHSTSLPVDMKARLVILAGSRMTKEGVLVIEARQYRTQEQNRADAVLRLEELVRRASVVPKVRRKTRPTLTSHARRLTAKKNHAQIKRIRHYVPEDFDE